MEDDAALCQETGDLEQEGEEDGPGYNPADQSKQWPVPIGRSMARLLRLC